MKYIHFPTLALHALLLILAQAMLSQYPGGFLVVGDAALLIHVIWSTESKRNLLPSHLLGVAVQLLAFDLGLIAVGRGTFGLGGGEFAQLFYSIALLASAVLEILIAALRYYRNRR